MVEEQLKIMSPEVASELPRIERLDAYLNHGYELLEEDAEYFDTVCGAFRIIYNCDAQSDARRKLLLVFPHLSSDQVSDVVDDAAMLFSDFFEINKSVKRRIVEKRFEYIMKRAIIDGDMITANKANAHIAKLNDLYSKEIELPKLPKNLPEIIFSDDPEVFKEQKQYVDGEAN